LKLISSSALVNKANMLSLSGS